MSCETNSKQLNTSKDWDLTRVFGFRASILTKLCIFIPLLMSIEANGQCEGPANLVDVTVSTSATKNYLFQISNKVSTSGIRAFAIGISDKEEMLINDENIPKTIKSPAGWAGQVNYFHESPYMDIGWDSTDIQYDILPNKKLAGFELLLNGAWSPPSKFSYTIVLRDGTCLWGKMTEQ